MTTIIASASPTWPPPRGDRLLTFPADGKGRAGEEPVVTASSGRLPFAFRFVQGGFLGSDFGLTRAGALNRSIRSWRRRTSRWISNDIATILRRK
jgi:hypothetical protein